MGWEYSLQKATVATEMVLEGRLARGNESFEGDEDRRKPVGLRRGGQVRKWVGSSGLCGRGHWRIWSREII